MKNFLDNPIVEHKSKPPLRWIANWAGNRASNAIMRISWAQENERTNTLRYNIDTRIWQYFFALYLAKGSVYLFSGDGDSREYHGQEWDSSECICSNCDEDEHCPGCIECEPDFEDEETGDAFRIL